MFSQWKKVACPHDCPGGCIMEARHDSLSDTLELRRPEKDLGVASFCAKGLRWFERRKSSLRIKTPLLRGEGGSFIPISWQKAWDLWAKALEDGLSRGGPLSNALYRSGGSLYFSKNFLFSLHASLGGYTSSMGNLCSSAGNRGLRNCFGQVPVQSLKVLRQKGKSLLFWGRNVLENHLSLVPLARELRNRGGSMGVLEIRSTPTVSWCDCQWILAPGGDCFLAAWLCRRLLKEKRAFPGWKSGVCNPEAFTAFLETLREEELLRRSGMCEEQALDLYEWLLESAPVTHYLGYGMQRYCHGELQAWWVGALAVLLGAFQVPGSAVVFGKDEMARFPESLLIDPPSKRSFPEGRFWCSLKQVSPSVHTLAIFCGNPVKQAPDGHAIAEAIREIPFSVCLDYTLTETARCCSLVLPSAFFFEEGLDWRGSYGHSLLCRTERLVPPSGECRGDVDIFDGLARTLGLSLKLLEKVQEMDSLLSASTDLEKIDASVYAWEEPNFWDFSSSASAKLPLKLPPEHLVRDPDPFELRLVSYHVGQYINGQNWDLSQESFLPISLSPKDAREIGVLEGDGVRLRNCRNPEGVLGRVRIDSAMRSGYCAVPQGNALLNTLTIPLVSPGYGVPFSESFVRLTKE